MPLKGAILIIIAVIIVAVLERDTIWDWLNSFDDEDDTNDFKEE